MRLISAASFVFILTIAFVAAESAQQNLFGVIRDAVARTNAGQAIFRYDTFGDEQLWTDVLRMHEVIPAIGPATALSVGLKVDAEALPAARVAALRAGDVDLDDPAVTVALLRLNAVVGVKGTVSESGELTSVGITCAL